jgi:hypothetical protein
MNNDEFMNELLITCSRCENDDWDVLRLVSLLLAEDRQGLDLSRALDEASMSGDNVKLVRLLLDDKRVDPSYDESSSLMCAIDNGRIKIVGTLLLDGRADPNSGEGMALDMAIEGEHNAIARLLLADTRTDPTLNGNKALFGAIHDCNYEMMIELANIEAVASSVDWEEMLGHALETEDEKMIDLVKSKQRSDE